MIPTRLRRLQAKIPSNARLLRLTLTTLGTYPLSSSLSPCCCCLCLLPSLQFFLKLTTCHFCQVGFYGQHVRQLPRHSLRHSLMAAVSNRSDTGQVKRSILFHGSTTTMTTTLTDDTLLTLLRRFAASIFQSSLPNSPRVNIQVWSSSSHGQLLLTTCEIHVSSSHQVINKSS